MKKFILRILIWLFPVLLLSVPADIFLSKQLKKSNYYAQDEFSVWNDLYDGKINSKIAVYGSSRAWVHIDPQLLEDRLGLKTYNLGIDGHNFWLQHLRHKVLLEYNTAPAYIIFSLDMFTLQKKTDLYNSDQFLPYMLWNTEMKKYIDTYEGYSTFDYYIPLVRYYGKRKAIKNAISNTIVPVNPDSGRHKGFKGNDEVWNKDFEIASRNMQFYEVNPDRQTIALFDEFLQDCRDKGIKVLFVYSPEFIDGQKFVSNRKEIMGLYKRFAEKYSLLFLDYSNDEMCLQRNYFYNASHLNKNAAELFTAKLINDLIRTNSQHGIAGKTSISAN